MDVAADLATITETTTGSFNTLHPVTDPGKVEDLIASMREHGWQGPPIVSEGQENAWTGVHRITAAARLWNQEGVEVEVPHIDIGDLCDAYGLDWEVLVDQAEGDEYEAAVTLKSRLPVEVVDYLGFDVDGPR